MGEYYKSTCVSQTCKHVWFWTGPKSGYGWRNINSSPEERGGTCPVCKTKGAKIGLDLETEGGKETAAFYTGVVNHIFGTSDK